MAWKMVIGRKVKRPKMVLDENENLIVNEMSVEEYLNKLDKLRSELEELGFSLINPTIECDLASFVKFYVTHQKCTEPIRVIVRPPSLYEYYSELGNLKKDGEIRLIYSYLPDFPDERRVQRGDPWTPSPREVTMNTVTPYKVKVPKPKEIVIIHGIGAPGRIECKDPTVWNSYTNLIKNDVKGTLSQLQFPKGTKLEISYEFPIIDPVELYELK